MVTDTAQQLPLDFGAPSGAHDHVIDVVVLGVLADGLASVAVTDVDQLVGRRTQPRISRLVFVQFDHVRQYLRTTAASGVVESVETSLNNNKLHKLF